MELGLSVHDRAFRDEVREFLDTHLTDDMRRQAGRTTSVFAEYDLNIAWHRILFAKGWVAPHWPKAYGGTGWSDIQRYIFAGECARAGAPNLSPMGLKMCGPMLMGFGTPEQKAFYLPRILSGEDYWCQGYSEPGSGSDLASLQCRAAIDGDDYVINGTKIWTTHAHYANRMFCLVRTSQGPKPQEGITFVLIDMATPGITIKPIITLAGDHEVNQVFFDDVRVPCANRVGAENDGWTVAKYLLEFERGNAYGAILRGAFDKTRDLAKACGLAQDDNFARKLAQVEIDLTAIEMTEHRIMSSMSKGGTPGPESSLLKTCGTELQQRIGELGVEALGYYAAPNQFSARQPHANVPIIGPIEGLITMPSYLNNRAASIYGGSNEIQRNIMAKMVLGL